MAQNIEEKELELKRAAFVLIESCRLDHVVRTIAKAGEYDGTANWRNEWDGKIWSCTSGAGTNGATVTVGGNLRTATTRIYEVNNFGKSVLTFRNGPWVQRAVQYASELEKLADKQASEKEAKRLATLKSQFEPYED